MSKHTHVNLKSLNIGIYMKSSSTWYLGWTLVTIHPVTSQLPEGLHLNARLQHSHHWKFQ